MDSFSAMVTSNIFGGNAQPALHKEGSVFGYRPPPSKNMGQIGIGDAKSCFWLDLGLAVADFLAIREMT